MKSLYFKPRGTQTLLMMKMLATLLASFTAHAESCPPEAKRLLADSRQLLLVTTSGWNDLQAQMELFQRPSTKSKWKTLGPSLPAVVGKSGMAWGHRYKNIARGNEPVKVEGDGRTPAGLHSVGIKFGFGGTTTPEYLALTPQTICVDDTRSAFYNQIIEADSVAKDWQTAEQMREITLYKIGLNVEYATDAASAAGSCIFIHLWRSATEGTAGCVASPESTILKLQEWIEPEAKPVALFLPSVVAARFRACLPGINVGELTPTALR